MKTNSALLMAVGDVFLDCAKPENCFDLTAPILAQADLLFGNNEGVYSATSERLPSAGWSVFTEPEKAVPLKAANFHVMSMANNHALDLGSSGLADTMKVLGAMGIGTVGAGRDREAAHRPLVKMVDGIRIGFLARSSVFPPGFLAKGKGPGIAGVRIHSHYYIPDWDSYGYIEPGVRPSVKTFPYVEDMEELEIAIRDLKSVSDIVVCSFHWGLAAERGVITDYERQIAHSAIDWGADLILGHHHHYLRGAEIYRGKPIFYGLGHFAFSNDKLLNDVTEPQFALMRERFGEYAVFPREGYPTVPFHSDGRKTMIAVVDITPSGVVAPGFIPCLINSAGQPEPLSQATAEGREVVEYVSNISRIAGLDTAYSVAERSLSGCEVIEISSAV